jgi:hypothetical protein
MAGGKVCRPAGEVGLEGGHQPTLGTHTLHGTPASCCKTCAGPSFPAYLVRLRVCYRMDIGAARRRPRHPSPGRFYITTTSNILVRRNALPRAGLPTYRPPSMLLGAVLASLGAWGHRHGPASLSANQPSRTSPTFPFRAHPLCSPSKPTARPRRLGAARHQTVS